MHVDTFHPTWKVFIFRDVSAEQGPLHYILGSHRNTESKMRWLFNVTYHIRSTRGLRKPLERLGPFSQRTHGFHPSLRVIGFDPSRPRPTPAESRTPLSAFGFAEPKPVGLGHGSTLVLVDVSGFHFRGRAAAGVERTASSFLGHGGGCLTCIPRKSPFHCETLPPDC